MDLTAGLGILQQRKNCWLCWNPKPDCSARSLLCADYATIKACRQHQLAAVAMNHTAERHVASYSRRVCYCHLRRTAGIKFRELLPASAT